MKKLKFILTISLITSLISCQPPFTFSEPQPKGTDNLLKFPNQLQGNYISLSDNSLLTIDDNLIKRVYDFDHKIHASQLDSNSRLVADTIFDLRSNEKTLVRHEGDSLVYHVYYLDTLFQINYDNVVRKYRGFYILNKRYDKESWEVKKMEMSKDKLVISSISTNDEIDNLTEITPIKLDTLQPTKLSATKKQFKEFLKNDGFNDSEIFVPQKRTEL